MPSRDDSDDETLSSLSRLTRSSQSQDSRMSCATSEYDANSEIESMDYIVPTQQVSQFLEEEALVLRDTLWGYLEPLNRQLPRIEFRRSQKRYRIGRTDLKEVDNDYVLADPRISNVHCIVMWDGQDDGFSSVEVNDLSSNGTFINGRLIGRGAYDLLRDGDVLAFASPYRPRKADDGHRDNRYVYHHTASLMNVSLTLRSSRSDESD